MYSTREIIPLTIKKLGIKKRYYAEMAVAHWPEIVGGDIASHSRAAGVQRSILQVVVTNSVWCHHLSMMKETFLQKITSFLGGEKLVFDIRFQIGSLRNYQPVDEDNREADTVFRKVSSIRLNSEERVKIHSMVAGIKDEELRNKLSRVLRKNLALQKAKLEEQWPICKSCGTRCAPSDEYCMVCGLAKRREEQNELKKLLTDAPWLRYNDISGYSSCSRYEFEKVRQEIIVMLNVKIQQGQACNLETVMLVMLVHHITPDLVTQDLVQQTLERVRRKNYVSASRI